MAEWKRVFLLAPALAFVGGAVHGEGDLSLRVAKPASASRKRPTTSSLANSLKIKSTGAKDCASEAPEFANAIWVRKVEAGEVEIKFSHLRESEFEREGERRRSSLCRSGREISPGAAAASRAREWLARL
jgi:hypothetical protein